jgi:hypothetical protein
LRKGNNRQGPAADFCFRIPLKINGLCNRLRRRMFFSTTGSSFQRHPGGAAGPSNFALLALSTSTGVQIAGANNQPPLPGGGVLGNVGIAGPTTLGVSSPASITGNVFLAPGASTNFSNPGVVGGTVFTNQNLSGRTPLP